MDSSRRVYILGGAQTDFARHYSREGAGLFEILRDAALGALADAALAPEEIEVAHLANFVGEITAGQGHLGGLFASIDPALAAVPTARHEAACASGSVAVLAASAELEAGRYGVACVAGVEQLRNVSGVQAADALGAAAWRGREAQEATYVWPHLFSRIAEEVDARYGLRQEHLARLAEIAYTNARANPNAQTRSWTFGPASFGADDAENPVVEGRLRRRDCAQVTDGGAAVILASEPFAAAWARRRGIALARVPVLRGFGHRGAPMRLEEKLAASRESPYLFPHVRAAVEDARRRAGVRGAGEIDGYEVHDCFTITAYALLDHLGLTPPGESWRAIDEGLIERGGRAPVNPSGGLIGVGHPVGASGIRMLLDAAKQVSGRAEGTQVAGARTFQTLNIGGSTTTVVSFIVGV
jgi:acetyl-CoA C-acetyltransferase